MRELESHEGGRGLVGQNGLENATLYRKGKPVAVKPLEAEEVREKVLALLKETPSGLRVLDLTNAIFGATDDYDKHRANSARISYALMGLKKAKRVKKIGGLMGHVVLSDGRPTPEIHDLPANGKRTRSRAAHNGTANPLRAYLIRDIKAKLAELEALE